MKVEILNQLTTYEIDTCRLDFKELFAIFQRYWFYWSALAVMAQNIYQFY